MSVISGNQQYFLSNIRGLSTILLTIEVDLIILLFKMASVQVYIEEKLSSRRFNWLCIKKMGTVLFLNH